MGLARKNALLSEIAAEALASEVALAEPGDRLGTKEELRKTLGVSVGTLNEAIRLVQARGLVTVKSGPSGGVFVAAPSLVVRLGNSMLALDSDADEVKDAARIRNALDPLLVADAVRFLTDDDAAALKQILEEMADAQGRDDWTTFARATWSLHVEIARVSQSGILRNFYIALVEIIESRTRHVEPILAKSSADELHDRLEIHSAIVDAIVNRDPEAADLAIRRHGALTTVDLDVGRERDQA